MLIKAILNESVNLGTPNDDFVLGDVILNNEVVISGFKHRDGYCVMTDMRIIFLEKSGYEQSKTKVVSVKKENVISVIYENAGKYDSEAVLSILVSSSKEKMIKFKRSNNVIEIYKKIIEWQMSN